MTSYASTEFEMGGIPRHSPPSNLHTLSSPPLSLPCDPSTSSSSATFGTALPSNGPRVLVIQYAKPTYWET